ncbi:WXG100 family type VII secretion target [Motilibacter deserti]|uniref:Type VII secretion system (Wss) protein ESAT-6 n=1 Tax=Motilibacter deserti TaxID=2714956 RepID=A0ABX0GR53_9ACTN|nr:WXG100 family type VII secretion target [Motilibacter deserti]NHC12940.1 hypothetical protein [Motilibacter deserti]
MADTQLELGAQARAAQTVQQALDPIQTTLSSLADALQSSGSGFAGGAAAGFAEAATAWFEAAQDLLPALQEYAGNLVATDVTAATTDAEQQAAYAARLAGRLGGPQ